MKFVILILVLFQTIKPNDFETLIEDLENLEIYIKEYKSSHILNFDSMEHLITCYIREGEQRYHGIDWIVIMGMIPLDLTKYIETKDTTTQTHAQRTRTYREIELPNGEKLDFCHFFAVMNGIENGGYDYAKNNALISGWGGDTVQLFQDIKNEKGELEELISIAKNYLGKKGQFNEADLISDLDAPIILNEKKKDKNKSFADIIEDYYNEEKYLDRIKNFMKLTFPSIDAESKSLDERKKIFREAIFDIYNNDFYIKALEISYELGDIIGVKSEYASHQKAAVYAFSDYLAENYDKNNNIELVESFTYKLKNSFLFLIVLIFLLY